MFTDRRVVRVLGLVLCLSLALVTGLSVMDYVVPLGLWAFSLGLLGVLFCHHIVERALFLYVCKRVLEALVVLWLIASVTFVLLRLIPGGPFDLEKALPPDIKANIEAKYNLNASLGAQYLQYMQGLLRGDLGRSYKYSDQGIAERLAQKLPVSFGLGFLALLVSYLLGVPAGVFAASRHNALGDHITMGAAISGVSLPSFLVAPLVVYVFCLGKPFNWLPPALWEGPTHYVLPVLVLGVRPAAIIARLTRASVLEVLRSDYVRTARAKGLSEARVLYGHVLKNSLIPVLTYSGPLVAGVLSGSFIVEHIFAIPGMGRDMVESVTNRDYPLVLGITLVFSALLVLANMVVDVLYSVFDPRIKLEC